MQRGIGRLRAGGNSLYAQVLALFAAGEQGQILDRSNLASMFQDSAGTTPVTMPGLGTADCPIGKALDLSGRGNHEIQATAASRPTLSARYNSLTNTAFSGAVAGSPGTVPTSWSFLASAGSTAIPASGITYSATTGNRQFIAQTLTLAANVGYTFSVDVLAATGADSLLSIVASAGSFTGTGNVLVSAGTGRKSVSIVAGVGGATVTARLGAGCVAGVGSDTSVTLANPDFRLTADATSSLPVYQSVTNASTYDTAGFPLYANWDGVDDGMATAATVDYSATDKMLVCIGLTKLSDVTGFVVEHSASDASNAGTFALYSSAGNYRPELRGDAAAPTAFVCTTPAAPVSSVVSVMFDIAGAARATEIFPRLNGAIPTLTAGGGADAGIGNLGNFTTYRGRRGGVSNPFQFRDYASVQRGATSTAAQIALAERWVASKMTGLVALP